MTALSAAGEPRALYPLAALAAAWLVTQERADDAVLVMLGVAGSAVLQRVLKGMVHRPRPYWKPIPTFPCVRVQFPSSHATMKLLATYGTMAYFLSRKRVAVPEGTDGKRSRSESPPSQDCRAHLGARAAVLRVDGWSRVYQGYIIHLMCSAVASRRKYGCLTCTA